MTVVGIVVGGADKRPDDDSNLSSLGWYPVGVAGNGGGEIVAEKQLISVERRGWRK